jgi:hypothetical protein
LQIDEHASKDKALQATIHQVPNQP